VGKTALRMLQYFSLATGRQLSGQYVFTRCKVLIISLEDDTWEMHRRIKAILDHYGIPRSEVKGRLFCACPKRAKLAETQNRTRVVGPLGAKIREAIELRKPDLVALDPFVKTHSLQESDSGDMDFVCNLLAELAVERNIAVDVPHHVHKGQVIPGDADSGRGSSSIKDACRLVYTLASMSAEEASTFNIPIANRSSYVRLDPAKTNLVEKSGEATWFKLVSVPIGNATERYPNGDRVQAAEPWLPPKPFDDIDNTTANVILSDIAQGPGNNLRYSNAPQTVKDKQAWRVVNKYCPQKSEAACRRVIHTWLNTGLLYAEQYYDSEQRKKRSGLYVDDTKRPPDVRHQMDANGAGNGA
jgi:hypothetical protein